MLYSIFLLISLCSSIVGAICGIGGGVIIKPVFDAFGVLSVSTISFLSSCTVFAMSCYSCIKAIYKKEKFTGIVLMTLAIGAALGGMVGKELFVYIGQFFEQENTIGAVQAFLLLILTVFTLWYTLHREQIKTLTLTKKRCSLLVGIGLGILSSFLGIGGGPINLVVLSYFFSMNTKEASSSSLFIILCSQFTSISNSIINKSIPEFPILLLLIMVCSGILGAIIGRRYNAIMKEKDIDSLFIIVMVIIILINIYNIYKYI